MKNNKNRTNSWRRKINKKNIADQNDKIVACERLAKDYNVSKVELLLQYEKFKREHSNGEISKEKFLLEEKEWQSLLLKQILTRSKQDKRTGDSKIYISWLEKSRSCHKSADLKICPTCKGQNSSYDLFLTSSDYVTLSCHRPCH